MRFPRPECPRRLTVVSVSAALLMPALTGYQAVVAKAEDQDAEGADR